MTEREYIINKARELGVTAEELGFAKQIETVTVKDEELYHDLRDYIEYNDDPETARDYFDEKYWDDLGIRPEKKYKIVEVMLEKKIYQKIKVVMPEDEDESNVNDYVGYNLNDLENDNPYDEDDWDYDYYEEVESGMTAKEIGYKYSYEDIWNYDDIED